MYANMLPATTPAPTARMELRRGAPAPTGTPSTCGWVTSVGLPGNNDNQFGFLPLTCAPGKICGSINSARGCCDDVGSCPSQVAVECYDSDMISTASPTTGPVLYCSETDRPSCIAFWYTDNFYTSWACGASDLYDVGTYFEAVPGSLAPVSVFDQAEVVTTFTSYLVDATPAAATTGGSSSDFGSGSGNSSTGIPPISQWPTYAFVIMALGIAFIVGTIGLSAWKRHKNRSSTYNGPEYPTRQYPEDGYPPPGSEPPSMPPHLKTPAVTNVDRYLDGVHTHNQDVNMPPSPPRTTWNDDGRDDDVFSNAPTGIGSEHHGRMPNFY